ncbi:GDSL-type esterase/lipase family protein [Agrobacterium salinitolerans]|uniref:GDSL-type esterase/lipase family protein n=1 Tax=Agrobacterium salinitolerans TaxID=1183413 RepID=A0A9X3R1P8_9HYPH|nr:MULTISPECIES: GDSL-type esterase/lipase family protein [Agrobacterium]MCZ7854626.1 GDSL-type esterase/lipase family protein [Agrobacterium salinitolerans]MCZ7893973.1 GDSL-type esterase/lipase family protein [Agrobacterium salinitolerans]MCZ7939924.1 GDSL-type esterase/lipase family protein [Agrobacterium salinitolerans]TRA84262.1 hypothetical protein EXN23_23220 [Agrobacterium salinitolerans]
MTTHLYHTPIDESVLEFEHEVNELCGRIARSAIPRRPIVFLGASSIRLWHDMIERLRPHNVVRVGFGGATLAAMTHYFSRLVSPLDPSILIIWPGSNDIGNYGATALQVADRTVQLVKEARAELPDLTIHFMSVFVPPGRIYLADEIRKANIMVETELQRNFEDVSFIDAHSALLGENGAPLGRVFSDDRIHLNRAGYDIVEDIIRRKSGILTGNG